MKVALVHDWLVSYAGSERVLNVLAQMFPMAPIYTLVYSDAIVDKHFTEHKIVPSYFQKYPYLRDRFRRFLPLMPSAFSTMDLREYDLVISSSHAFSKCVQVNKNALHICYCHTPIRYLWSHHHDYREFIRSPAIRSAFVLASPWLRKIDYQAAQRVNVFVANSHETQARIREYYNRDSRIIYPPVSLSEDANGFGRKQGGFFLCLGRLVPYKRVDIAARACTNLGTRLVIAGEGPEMSNLVSQSGSSVEFVGAVSELEKRRLLNTASALIFCGYEDFGIVMVEALQAGCPIICFRAGGALDILEEGVNGVSFNEQSVESLERSLRLFQDVEFNEEAIRASARRFLPSVFQAAITNLINEITS